MAVKCPKCQAENPETSRFCANCGAQLIPPGEAKSSFTETLEVRREELTTGSTFAGRYQIIEELGKGGMGRVYKVFDTDIKEKVALKLLKPEIASDRETIERFSNELKFARKIRHKNVCGMYDLGKEEGTHFITMEYVHGEDLKSMLRMAAGLSIGAVLSIGKQICEGLEEAHNLGVVHRDLKPQNIMIDKGGNAKIMDFGIARSMREKGITGPSMLIGTPEYMSPEQTEASDVDLRSDVYSLGVILYEMATGHVPFEGETALSVAIKHKTEIPKDPKSINPNIPDDLKRLILKCLEKEKAKRYQAASDVRADLEKIEKSIPLTERRVPERKPMTSREITVKFSLRKVLIPALGVFGLGVIAIGLMIWSPWKPKESAQSKSARPSMAILPFVDLSPQRDQEYFCDGMTDEIISKLSNLKEWKVIPRTSVMQYKTSNKTIRQIGQELEVENILEGSVRKEDDNIRVNCSLIKVADSSPLWSETYNQKLDSIFQIQSSIANNIAKALETQISQEESEQLIKKPTTSLEAYDYYLRGRNYYYIRNREANENAIKLFQRAIDIDPNYALAYSGLGDSYSQRTLRYGFSDEWLDEAIEVSDKAISIDPKLAEGYKALGLAFETKGWFQRAKEAYEKAVELNPNYSPAVSNLSYVYWLLGELDKALILAKKAYEQRGTEEPSFDCMRLGNAYFCLNEYSKAEEWYRKSLELEPGITFTTRQVLYRLSMIYCLQGDFQKARSQIRQILEANPKDLYGLELAAEVEIMAGDCGAAKEFYGKTLEIYSVDQINRTNLGYAHWKTGDLEEARKLLGMAEQEVKGMLAKGSENPRLQIEHAEIRAIQGDKEGAYEWLDKAIHAGWRLYAWSQKDPRLENLHNEVRFQKTMQEVKAMVDEMRERVKSDI